MTKRQLEFVQDLKKKLAKDMARRTRKAKKESLERVLAKGKVETYDDIYDIFNGLSKKAMEIAAIDRIQVLARMGYSPARIIEVMEVKRGKRHE